MNYFVIAEREIVLAFGLVGVQGAAAVNRAEALDAFNRVTGKGGTMNAPVDEERPKVLILTEEVSMLLEDEVIEWQKGARYPLIVEIPGINGHLSGRKTLTDAIREAVGIQV
ncbi:MAG: V-type ATP synthase subunit F [Treponema sp.]|nr:V-type ATP synthase subunit F [Treponema sp.]